MLLTRTANASVTSPSRLARGLAGVMAKTTGHFAINERTTEQDDFALRRRR